MKKKLILKISLSIIAIVLVIVLAMLVKPRQTSEGGTITIIAIDSNSSEVIHDDIAFLPGEKKSLYELISSEYECTLKNGMLLKIGDLEAFETSEYFIKILKNDEMSNRGILEMTYKDKDVIKFVYTKTGGIFEN